eukprot:gene4256-5326_t
MTGKRISIVATFAILFIIGIPVWWKTTTTYRADVDFSQIIQYNETKEIWPKFNSFLKDFQRSKDDNQVKTSTEYCLSFTLLNSDPSFIIPKWDFPYLSNKYIQPFIEQISDIANFTIQSKISHYSTLMKPPSFDDATKSYYIPANTLSQYINPNEWKLDTTSTNQPTLNFIIYIPPKNQSPLYIRSTSNKNNLNSFLIPQWGGIVIHSFNETDDSNVNNNNNRIKDVTESVQNDMIIFRQHLKKLLGISSSKSTSTSTSTSRLNSIEIEETIKRYTAENINNTISTLTSLASLIESLPNMQVLENIRIEVLTAITSLNLAHQRLEMNDYRGALHASKVALVASENAFFDKNMLSQLYFPDEHKYAVYTPLFVPVCFPIIAGTIQELKHFLKKRKQQKQQQQQSQTQTQKPDDKQKSE